MMATRKKTDDKPVHPAEAGHTSTTAPIPGDTEECAYCGHLHYKVDTKDQERRGEFELPCPDCDCQLRAGTTGQAPAESF